MPVAADIFQFYLQLSKYPTNPFGNEYYATQFENITKYDDRTLSITVADARPLTPYFTSVPAAPRHYYREFGPDFEQRYDWRSRPSTGAFIIHEEDVKKGYSITLSRVTDWWAKDKKFYKNRWNVDRIEMRVIREQEKALEMFKVGLLDTFILNLPEYWYEKTDVEPVFNGYIEKGQILQPMPPRQPGALHQHQQATPQQSRCPHRPRLRDQFRQSHPEFDLRNDYSRMRTFADGYGDLSHPTLKAREFSPQKAREAFARAGFTSTGKDGVLVNAAKQRLSFEITYPKSATGDKIMQRLKEEALKVGVEYKLDGVDGTSYFKKATLKQHDITLSGFGLDPPFMDYFQFFHSKDAYEPDGKTPKTNTNNLFCYANPEMDKWATIQRNATTIEEMREASHKCEEFIHRDAIFIPGYVQDYYRIGYWRWVRFPANTFNVKIAYDAMEAGVQWVDEDIKKETLAAMRSGKTYPEVLKVYDQYRVKSGSPEEDKQP
ncbi:MAG: ABC transporter substrate-binding protein [Verrucomicrobiales bacterium]